MSGVEVLQNVAFVLSAALLAWIVLWKVIGHNIWSPRQFAKSLVIAGGMHTVMLLFDLGSHNARTDKGEAFVAACFDFVFLTLAIQAARGVLSTIKPTSTKMKKEGGVDRDRHVDSDH